MSGWEGALAHAVGLRNLQAHSSDVVALHHDKSGGLRLGQMAIFNEDQGCINQRCIKKNDNIWKWTVQGNKEYDTTLISNVAVLCKGVVQPPGPSKQIHL